MYFIINKSIRIISSVLLLSLAFYYLSLGIKDISIIINSKEELSSKEKASFKEYKDTSDYIEQSKILDENIDSLTSDKIVKKETPSSTIDIEKEEEIEIYEKINEILVKKDENLNIILIDQKILNNKEIQNIINSLGKIINLKKLKIGQKIIFYYKKNQNDKLFLEKISLPISFEDEAIVQYIDGQYIAKKITLPIIKEKIAYKIIIKKSLFEAGIKKAIPNSVLIDLIRLYSFDVDFQRDIRVNDEYTLMYEIFYNEKRREVAYGDILYANLNLQGKNIEYFLFESIEGLDYFNREGKNVRKSIMKTPIDGARLSSGFGIRKHPILGYNMQHRGVDFAAPKGTPVFAAGNGTIEYVGRNGAYGKYIRIRHNNAYKTAYAHLNGYKKGISVGKRVNQGEIIAYVGSTGRSTGPHLHYEVILSGKRINPMKMKLPSKKILKGNELENFLEESHKTFTNMINILEGEYD